MSESLPFRIIVTSCAPYAPTTLPPLFESLRAAGVPIASVTVVVAQCRALPPEFPDLGGASVVPVPYAAEALAGLVCAAETDLVDTPWFLYIQDCSLVGPDFVRRCSAVHAKLDASLDVVKLVDKYSLSVGFYRTAWLQTLAPELAKLRVWGDADGHVTDDVVRRLKCKSEDAAFSMAAESRTGILGYWRDPECLQTVNTSYTYPGSTVRRVVEHYKVLDYYKLKSWWGQTGDVGVFVDEHGDCPKFPVGC